MSDIAAIVISIALLVFVGVFSTIFLYRKKQIFFPAVLLGIANFMILGVLLEQYLYALILNAFTNVRNNIYAYSIISGLLAGVFEESGIFLIGSTVLKKYNKNIFNGVLLGIGDAVTFSIIAILAFIGKNAAPANIFLGLLMRLLMIVAISAVASISFNAATERKRMILYPAAVLMHFILECGANLMSVKLNAGLAMAGIAMLSVLYVGIAFLLLRRKK